jgi:hypothetical protein
LCGKSESCLALVDSASALTERGTVISMRSYLYAYATTTPLMYNVSVSVWKL